ncbi:hypothetical protein [Reticulibacter mediterranei]|nr:hypothetical protein [Reticulibacter mediterranei]
MIRSCPTRPGLFPRADRLLEGQEQVEKALHLLLTGWCVTPGESILLDK